MINGLDLFSGIGGITIGLSEWVRPVAYCEIDPYCQSVLISRMLEGTLPTAPIWDDVKTLQGADLPEIDIICGGFPCQDISVAGHGKGLEGERSGLFFEIVRLAKEVKPTFLFLENVPAITSRGGLTVVNEITEMGYDCRWTCLSAAEVGANHKRERWWLLAHAGRKQQRPNQNIQSESKESVGANPSKLCCSISNYNGQQEHFKSDWWAVEPDVGRVVNGLPFRMDRVKSLGNAVVPLQAKEAFKELMGFKIATNESNIISFDEII